MAKRPSLIKEFAAFALANKKWWLLPLILIVLAFAAVVFLSGTPAAPFIYTLF
jgi:hypothetical protein